MQQFIIFNVFRKEDSYNGNFNNDAVTRCKLESEGIKFAVLDGSYGNVHESSLLVDAQHENRVIEIAKVFQQESILFVDKTRRAFLVYLADNKTVQLKGRLQCVDRDVAIKQDSFSRNVVNNKYYAVV